MQFNDYHQLKRAVTDLQQELSNSESKCSELTASHKQQEHTLKQLQTQLSQPSDLISLQDELSQLRVSHRKQLLVLEFDKKHLGKQLAVQMEHGLQLQKRLDQQLLQLKSAQHEVDDLQSLLQLKCVPRAVEVPREGHVSCRGHRKGDITR